MIHRADALERCLAALAPAFGSLSLVPVHANAEEAATRIVVSAEKGGRAPTRLLPAVTLHGPDGRFTPAVERLQA